MIFIYNSSIWETEVGLQVQNYLDLHIKLSQKSKKKLFKHITDTDKVNERVWSYTHQTDKVDMW